MKRVQVWRMRLRLREWDLAKQALKRVGGDAVARLQKHIFDGIDDVGVGVVDCIQAADISSAVRVRRLRC